MNIPPVCGLVAICVACSFASSSFAVDYYVDSVAGSDSNSGTSISQPWKTLDKVNLVNLEPGDTVNLKAGSSFTTGDYQTVLVFMPEDSGTTVQPVTVRSYGTGAKPLLSQMYNENRNSAVVGMFGAVSNIVIDGLHMKGLTGPHSRVNGRNGIDVFSTALLGDSSLHTNITIRNCEIQGGTRGLLLYNCVNVTVSNNYIHDINDAAKNTRDNQSPLWPEEHPERLNPSYPLNPATYPVGADDDSGAEAIDHNSFCEDIVISGNVIENCSYLSSDYGPDGTFIEVYGTHTKNIQVFNNIVRNVPGGTVEMGSWGGGIVENFVFHHNLITEASTFFVIHMTGMYSLSAIADMVFDNNTFVQRAMTDDNLMPWTIFDVNGVLTDPSKLKVRNNVFHLKTGTKKYWNGGAASNMSSVYGNDDAFTHTHNLYFHAPGAAGRFLFAMPLDGTETSTVDPLFVNAAGSDFHLSSSSPGIDAGGSFGYTVDLEGSPIPSGAAPDRGAYEASSSSRLLPVGSTAGAQETGNTKEKAYDNSIETRWCNDGTLANAWIQLDLGSAKPVGKVRLMLENNHIVSYPIKIQVGDGTTFADVFSGTTNLVGWKTFQDFTFPAASGRYVRIQLTGANSQGYYWFSAWEIETYAASGLTISASTVGAQQAGNEKAKAYDGDPATRWCNDGTLANAWIQFDLGASKSVKKVRLMLENNHLYTYPIKIEVGNGTTFSTVYTGSSSLVGWKQFQDFSFSPTSGRYVRVSLTGANSQGYYWFSAWEVALE
jgi:hypothetical protein